MSDATTKNWVEMAMVMIARDGAVVRASLVEVKGSAPREAGAMMLITPHQIWHSIGGGALEYDIMRRARQMISSQPPSQSTSWTRQVIPLVLGPDMGQCCGGQVRVLLESFGPRDVPELSGLASRSRLRHPLSGHDPLTDAGDVATGMIADRTAMVAPVIVAQSMVIGRPVFLYGAGHVGRALAPHLLALDCDLHWVDVADDRFPAHLPSGARRVLASDPTVIAAHAPAESIHLVMTHDHALDEAICHRIFTGGGFARLGLIGSRTKAARFKSRLARAGVPADQLDRLACPVGLPGITGKQPARVALSIAGAVAIWQQELDNSAGATTLKAVTRQTA